MIDDWLVYLVWQTRWLSWIEINTMNTIMIVVTPKMNPECLITLYELDREKRGRKSLDTIKMNSDSS